MSVTRRAFFASTVAMALLSAMGAASSQELTPISFRLDWSIYGTHAPFYLALKEGLYEEAELDVTIGEGQGSATVLQLVAQGNDPIGFIDFGTAARGIEQGMPVKAVARVVSNVMCVISHAESPIKSPADLAGKIVAYGAAESTGLVFPALLASQDVDPTSVSVINPATGAKNALFLQGRADAIPANVNVQIAQLEAAGAEIDYFMMSDYGIEQMNNGLVANESFLAEHPDAMSAFIAVTGEAFKRAEADPEAAVDALIEALPEQARNRNELLRQLELTLPQLTTEATQDKPFGWMEAADWDNTQSVLVDYLGMPNAIPVEEFYTNEFIGGQ
ncbi:ABC transporter substrate-binding protein [Aureimonas sp. OT7]|uniref:ABC transporter substrate-binding protein n=1 Tax=Aureimonas sp. OT7 TaxID=2816454 RepID=UPI00177F03C3|nr:ABC transporter substrate-binding protein [Aureimonas sp. OT7]QOG07277.1 ABC transporter substrate-binding protein [Aureimonas sp. OT7]